MYFLQSVVCVVRQPNLGGLQTMPPGRSGVIFCSFCDHCHLAFGLRTTDGSKDFWSVCLSDILADVAVNTKPSLFLSFFFVRFRIIGLALRETRH